MSVAQPRTTKSNVNVTRAYENVKLPYDLRAASLLLVCSSHWERPDCMFIFLVTSSYYMMFPLGLRLIIKMIRARGKGGQRPRRRTAGAEWTGGQGDDYHDVVASSPEVGAGSEENKILIKSVTFSIRKVSCFVVSFDTLVPGS